MLEIPKIISFDTWVSNVTHKYGMKYSILNFHVLTESNLSTVELSFCQRHLVVIAIIHNITCHSSLGSILQTNSSNFGNTSDLASRTQIEIDTSTLTFSLATPNLRVISPEVVCNHMLLQAKQCYRRHSVAHMIQMYRALKTSEIFS